MITCVVTNAPIFTDIYLPKLKLLTSCTDKR